MHDLDGMFFNLNFNEKDVTHLSLFFLCFCLNHNTKPQIALFGQQSYLHVTTHKHVFIAEVTKHITSILPDTFDFISESQILLHGNYQFQISFILIGPTNE